VGRTVKLRSKGWGNTLAKNIRNYLHAALTVELPQETTINIELAVLMG
jgi:hypothetical protein